MLEDDFTYVIRKAFKGLALSPGEAALRAGLPETEVLAFSRGKFSPAIARGLAPVLGLKPAALAAHNQYEPAPIAIAGVHRLELPFGDDHVNAWLISKNGIHLLFDTGDDPTSCAHQLDVLGVPALDEIFITHFHHDHIGGLSGLKSRGAKHYGPQISGTEPIDAGAQFDFDDLTVRAIDLSGHATPALGYLIEGLEHPVLIPGDAIFAGSIGGCPDTGRYHHAIERIKTGTAELEDRTVILPGHGPATTLGEERLSNPFF
jgi:glyoxylase-like metal-dependent hydrolase (beta-lactamase superfamily II)